MISITTLAKIKMAAEKADDFDVEALLEETYNKVQPLPVPDDESVVSKEASNRAIRIILNKFFEAAPINATVWAFMKFLTSYVTMRGLMVTVCSTLGVTTHWSTPHDHTPQPPTHLFLINAQHTI